MAGSYPDNPKRRFAYDDDATVVLVVKNIGGSTSPGVPPGIPYLNASVAEMQNLNDEDHASFYGRTTVNATVFVTMLFPEKREIDGLYHVTGGDASGASHTAAKSENTTNGYDGTWVDLALADLHNVSWVADHYRDNIESQAESNVLGLMFKVSGNPFSEHRLIHVFGTQTAGGTPDRLIFLDPDNADAEFTKPLDFGDVPRGQTQTDTFKVKNNSSTASANTVQVTGEDLFGGAGAWYEFSDDDVVYTATLGLGNISAAGSKLVYVRQVVPDAQTPGVYVARVKANQASWS